MKNFRKKQTAAVLVITVLMFLFASCSLDHDIKQSDLISTDIAVEDISNKDEFCCVGAATVYSLDPFTDTSGYYDSIFAPLYDRLLCIDGNGNITPGLIESWNESEDGLSYSFKLKDKVYFSNGNPFTTEALKLAWEYAKTEFKISGYAKWSVISSIDCTDKLNMTVHLRKTDPQFIINVAQSAYVEPETFRRVGAEKYWNNPIGCGRYVLASRYPGKSITFYKNENYWADNSSNPSIITYVTADDAEARVKTFCEGKADMILDIPYEHINDVRSDVDVMLIRTAGTTELWLGTQCKESSPCSDIMLRRAISLCIDRSLIAVNIYGNGYPIYSSVPSYIFAKSDYSGNEFFRHDTESAREYLEKSSYDGETLKMIVPISKFGRVDEIVQTINAMLSSIGINTEIQMLEGAAYTSARGNGEYDLCLQSHRFVPYDIRWIWQQFVYNHGKYHYDNDAALKLITDAYHSKNLEECTENINKALEIMSYDCAPMIPISVFETNGAYRSQWTGINIYSDGRFDIENVIKK